MARSDADIMTSVLLESIAHWRKSPLACAKFVADEMMERLTRIEQECANERWQERQSVACSGCGEDLTDGGSGCQVCEPDPIFACMNVAAPDGREECPSTGCHARLLPGEDCPECADFAEDDAQEDRS